MGAALLALGAAALWGSGDFLGGVAARRTHVLRVLFWSQLVGLLGLGAWVAVSGDALPGPVALLAALGAGVAGVAGLACLYRGLALGAMGVVAPISATYPVVALGIDVALGRSPDALQWVGIALALAGVVLVSRDGSARRAPLAVGVGLALVAALGFGFFVVGLGVAADDSAAWAAGTARLSSTAAVAAVALATRSPVAVPAAMLPLLVAVGSFDAGASVLLALATTKGDTGVVAVLSALYPLVTILLARLLLDERLSAQRRVGGVLALAGAACVAVG